MGGEIKGLLMRSISIILLIINILIIPLPSSASYPHELFQVGTGAFKDGFYKVAEAQFREFLQAYPQHPYTLQVMYLLGKALYEQKKFSDAKEIFAILLNSKKDFQGNDAVYFWLARSCEEINDLSCAQNNLLTIVKEYHRGAWYLPSLSLMGKISFKEGQYKSSESYLRKALEDHRITPALSCNIKFWLGLSLYEQGKYKDAERLLQNVANCIVKGIPHEETLYWLGETQLKLGRYKEGVETFHTFLSWFPQSFLTPNALYGECLCLFLTGKKEKAVQGLLTLSNSFPHAPLLPQALSLIGEIYINLGKYQEAITILKELLSRFPQNRMRGEALLNMGWCYLKLGNLSKVKEVAYEIIKLSPGEREKTLAQYILAELNSYEGKYHEAMPYWFNLVNISSYRQEALFKIALCSFKEGKFKECLTNLELLQLEYPNFKRMDEVLWIQGESFREFRNLLDASKVYQIVIKDYKLSPWYPWCLYRMIAISLDKEEIKEAERYFDILHKIFFRHEVYYESALQLGIIRAKRVEYESSLRYLDIATHSFNKRVKNNALCWKGEIYLNLKEYQKALNYYQRIVDEIPSAGDMMAAIAYLEIGNIKYLLGKYEEANDSYKKAIEISGNEEFKKRIEELMRKLESSSERGH